MASLPTCTVVGVRCAVGDITSAADAVIEHALSGAGGYGVFCNVHVTMAARQQPELMRAIENAWAVFPDGAPIAWMQRRNGARGAKRIGGPDLMPAVFERGRPHGLRHALFGSTPDVVFALAERLGQRFPGAKIVAACAPAREEENDKKLVSSIAATRPQVVWCALGAPKQELWMAERADSLFPALVLGVGAAFDFNAGTKKRAPRCMRTAGLEWAHRLISEPRRLTGRYSRTNAAFAALVLGRVARGRSLE